MVSQFLEVWGPGTAYLGPLAQGLTRPQSRWIWLVPGAWGPLPSSCVIVRIQFCSKSQFLISLQAEIQDHSQLLEAAVNSSLTLWLPHSMAPPTAQEPALRKGRGESGREGERERERRAGDLSITIKNASINLYLVWFISVVKATAHFLRTF